MDDDDPDESNDMRLKANRKMENCRLNKRESLQLVTITRN